MLADGLGLVGEDVHLVALHFLLFGGADGTSEEIFVFLVGEVNVIVPVRVRELGGVPTVILIEGVAADRRAVLPGLQLQVGDGAAAVVVRHLHGASVGLVVDDFGSSEPLLLLAETLEDVIGADLHDVELLALARGAVLATGSLARLELADLAVATARDHVGHQGHELGVLHDGVAVATLASTESLRLAVGDPVIVGLVLLVVLLERVIQGTVKPVELGDRAEVEGHLGVFIRGVVVA
mmetsp:Transcript_20124/g.24821  ORF Transcript_20124/g.24821 Transcript_20124/m.24821 type:complete len:238 (+) Transcript_20124:292-1005(+)